MHENIVAYDSSVNNWEELLMAVNVNVQNPASLLALIKRGIDERAIQTWAYDGDGDFTHSAQQWNRKAWLRPSLGNGGLVLNIVSPQGQAISKEIYGVYHGRFIEMLLVHFDDKFSSADATAMPTYADALSA
jgi:hypothetical protein